MTPLFPFSPGEQYVPPPAPAFVEEFDGSLGLPSPATAASARTTLAVAIFAAAAIGGQQEVRAANPALGSHGPSVVQLAAGLNVSHVIGASESLPVAAAPSLEVREPDGPFTWVASERVHAPLADVGGVLPVTAASIDVREPDAPHTHVVPAVVWTDAFLGAETLPVAAAPFGLTAPNGIAPYVPTPVVWTTPLFHAEEWPGPVALNEGTGSLTLLGSAGPSIGFVQTGEVLPTGAAPTFVGDETAAHLFDPVVEHASPTIILGGGEGGRTPTVLEHDVPRPYSVSAPVWVEPFLGEEVVPVTAAPLVGDDPGRAVELPAVAPTVWNVPLFGTEALPEPPQPIVVEHGVTVGPVPQTLWVTPFLGTEALPEPTAPIVGDETAPNTVIVAPTVWVTPFLGGETLPQPPAPLVGDETAHHIFAPIVVDHVVVPVFAFGTATVAVTHIGPPWSQVALVVPRNEITTVTKVSEITEVVYRNWIVDI